ncbi:MAG: hypothetical protein ACREJ3_17940, partial [Polyangiaceae bacterium]
MAEHKEDAPARITNQFRSRDAMVYDLSCEGARLTISIAPRTTEEGADQWSAEAHARQAPERPAIVECGATRGDGSMPLADRYRPARRR